MSEPVRGRLSLLAALLAAGLGGSQIAVPTPPATEAADQVFYLDDQISGPPAATEAGFTPSLCAGNLPPAELLALADWPLDEDGSKTCLPRRIPIDRKLVEVVERSWAKVEPEPVEEVGGHAEVVPLAEVADRIWRRARDVEDTIADSGGRAQQPAPLAEVAERIWRRAEDVRVQSEAARATAASEAAVLRQPIASARAEKTEASDQVARVESNGARPRDTERMLIAAAVVDDELMDTLRGGFETPGGLVMSFGIERLVYINGALSSMTKLNVADLGQLSGAGIDPSQVPAIGSTVAVIQNGPNNTFVAEALGAGAFATVIQNSLDNQHIQSVTTVTATVNSLELMRANRLGESLRSAVSGSMMR